MGGAQVAERHYRVIKSGFVQDAQSEARGHTGEWERALAAARGRGDAELMEVAAAQRERVVEPVLGAGGHVLAAAAVAAGLEHERERPAVREPGVDGEGE